MVDVDRLAGELEVRVLVVAAITPPAPGRGLLLGDADQHDAPTAITLGGLQERAREVLLAGALGEPHHRDLVIQREAIDGLHVAPADPAQDRRRRDVAAHAVKQEPHQLPVALQRGHVAGQKDPVHRPHLEGHVVAQ
jgi:hypothetical protein